MLRKIILRDYQEQAAQQARASRENFLINAPTGSGKSFMIGRICELVNERILVLSHTRELVRQDADSIEKLTGEKPSIYCAGLNEWDMTGRIVVGTIQSVMRYSSSLDFKYIIIDECHRIGDHSESSYRNLLRRIPQSKLIGLSATPYRMFSYIHGDSPNHLFKRIHFNIEIDELVDKEYLIMPKLVRGITKTDLSDVEINCDYISEQVQQVYSNRLEEIVNECSSIIPERNRTLIFCVAIEQSEQVAKMLNERGINTGCVSSRTPLIEREEITRNFKEGKLKVLTSVNVFLEGWDVPEADMAVLIRPTQSPILYAQSVGRIMRPAQGKKDALLLDFGQNYSRFGAINKMGIPKIFETKEEREVERNRYRSPCKKCGFKNLKKEISCIECGHVFLSNRSYKYRHGYGLQPFDIELIEHWYVYRNSRDKMKEIIERYSQDEIFKHIELTKFINVSNSHLWNAVEMFMNEEDGYKFNKLHKKHRKKVREKTYEKDPLIMDVREMKDNEKKHEELKAVPPKKSIINPRLNFKEYDEVKRVFQKVQRYQSNCYIMPYLYNDSSSSLKILIMFFHDKIKSRHWQWLNFDEKPFSQQFNQWGLFSSKPNEVSPSNIEEAWERKGEIGGSRTLEFVLRKQEIQVIGRVS